MDLSGFSLLEIYFSVDSIVSKKAIDWDNYQTLVLHPNPENSAELLALAVDHVDILLQDWYPTLSTRFVHTSEGQFIVTRLILHPFLNYFAPYISDKRDF